MGKALKIILFTVFLTSMQCSKVDNPSVLTKNDFAIYLLQNPDTKIEDILTKELADQDSAALSKIEIQKLPWLTNNDIDFYDFSCHIAYLKQDKYHFFPPLENKLFPISWWDKPFMVIADGQRRYVGLFKGSISSGVDWPLPKIDDEQNLISNSNDLLFISWAWFYNGTLNDSRQDIEVKKALGKANILHNGITLKLKKIIFDNNADTASVEYTYTILNLDQENLYVIDPDKMGPGLFHYYNNGPVFQNVDEPNLRESTLKKVIAPQSNDFWSRDWFTKIYSGDSITRTVNLKGYPFFPSGIYYCELSFQCVKQIQKSQRTLSDGRYWLGPTKSNVLTLQY